MQYRRGSFGLSFSSLRARIGLLFFLSLSAFTLTLFYAMTQLQQIKDGLYVLNAYYLPLAEESTQLEVSMRQLSREHDRYSEGTLENTRRSPPLYLINLILDDIDQADQLHQLVQKTDIPYQEIDHNSNIGELISGIKEAATSYEENLRPGLAINVGSILAKLDRDHSELNIRIGQLNSLLSDQIQLLSTKMAEAQARTIQIFGLLALVVLTFSGSLAIVATRVIQPLETLTALVQRLRMGDYAERIPTLRYFAGDEVRVLSREINAMADAVAERNTELSERAKALDELSERLQKVLNTIPIGILLVRDQTIEMVNPVGKNQWGVLEQQPIPDFLNRDPGVYREVKLKEEIFTVNVTPFGKNGVLISTENISDRVNNRESLAKAQKLALVGRMLAQITHEVRNPLNAMSLNTEMLEEEIQSADGKEMLAIISKEIERLEQTTERYLALTRKSAPTLALDYIKPVIHEVCEIENQVLQQQGVLLKHMGPDYKLRIDRSSIMRTLRNLIRNACEAGASQIEIHTDNEFRIHLIDNGDGISPEVEQHIFDPFYTTKPTGTGLGLSICRQELEEWGAQLILVPNTANGSHFELRLPKSGTLSEDPNPKGGVVKL
jgi:signal transduction histidine kinase